MQISAGVDVSLAVSTTGDVYGWGCTKDGRIGVRNIGKDYVSIPHKIEVKTSNGDVVKAVDVEAGFMHSVIVGLDGSLYACNSVETDLADASPGDNEPLRTGMYPCQIPDFNIWHRLPEPKEETKNAARWKKYGKYELKGRSAAMTEKDKWS